MDFYISAEIRNKTGKKYNLKLRNTKKIPAVIYFSRTSISILLDFLDVNKIIKCIYDGIHIFNLNINNDKYSVIVKEFKRHPVNNDIIHLDFQKIDINDNITVDIPLRFINEKNAIGIKHGGFLIKHKNFIKINCLVSNLPDFIDIDLSNLNVNRSIFLSNSNVKDFFNGKVFKIVNKSNILIASIIGSRSLEQKTSDSKTK